MDSVNSGSSLPQSRWMSNEKDAHLTPVQDRGSKSVPPKPHLSHIKKISLFHKFDVIPDEKDELRIQIPQGSFKIQNSTPNSPQIADSPDRSVPQTTSPTVTRLQSPNKKKVTEALSPSLAQIAASISLTKSKASASPEQNLSERELQVQTACKFIDNLMKQRIVDEMRQRRKY